MQNQLLQVYANLFNKFHSLACRIFTIIDQIKNEPQVQEILSGYFIEYNQVSKNVAASLRDIREFFITKFPKSLKAVESVLLVLETKVTMTQSQRDASSTKKANTALQLQICLQNICQLLESVWLHEDDIASFPNFDNPHFHQVYSKITIVNDPHPEKSEKQDAFLKKIMTITNAAVLAQLAQKNCVLGLITFGFSFPRFAFGFDTAELRNSVFLRHPSAQILSQIWNLPEKGAISRLKYLQFQCITTNRLLYFPKNHQNQCSILEQGGNKIPVRLIHSDQIQFWSQPAAYSCCKDSILCEVNCIILHFHGGGFVSLSSDTTQSYTRRWANNLNVPVLSVDYSLAPHSKFPTAVEEAFQVYLFLITKLSSLCNINPTRIILAGDSAGGNLVCSLMGLIIRERLQQPVGILLAYPACSLRICYSPSRLHSFLTPILHPSLLYTLLKEYLGQNFHQTQNHPLASPLFLTKHFVGEKYGDYSFPSLWPRTHILVGDKDPLFDDSLRLCQRMTQAKIDVNCRVYRNLNHGFLSLEKVVARGEDAILDSIRILRSFMI